MLRKPSWQGIKLSTEALRLALKNQKNPRLPPTGTEYKSYYQGRLARFYLGSNTSSVENFNRILS